MRAISYTRVSTAGQSTSGLGLDAQRVAVAAYLRGRGELIAEFTEVESGRKEAKRRPELTKALAECKRTGAVLVIGKLDRLSRSVRFFLEVIDDSGVDIRFADLPDICPATDEGRMILVSMANFAEFEARRISTRTKAALAAAKARGVPLGTAGVSNLKANIIERQAKADAFAAKLAGLIEGMFLRGISRRAMVSEMATLNVRGVNGGHIGLAQLQRVIARMYRISPASEVAVDAA
jgi:DNA invertase Pin-like site-specific DNA recombinase